MPFTQLFVQGISFVNVPKPDMTKNIINSQLFLTFIISTFLLCGCKIESTGSSNQSKSSGPQVGNILQINPDLLIQLSSMHQNKQNPWKASRKIISFVDGGCSMCGFYLSRWQDLIENYAQDWEAPVIIIATGNSRSKIEYMAYDQLNYAYPLFYDSTRHVINDNEIIDHPELNTFLLDSANRVIIVGNPTEDQLVLNLYRDLLEKEE